MLNTKQPHMASTVLRTAIFSLVVLALSAFQPWHKK